MRPSPRVVAAAATAATAAVAASAIGVRLRTVIETLLAGALGLIAAFLGEAAVIDRMVATFEMGRAPSVLWAPALLWDGVPWTRVLSLATVVFL